MQSRRSFLRTLSASGAGLALGQSQAAGAVRQNIIFFSVDDLNDWIQPLRGYPGVITPNLDRLAREGALFTNAHCASPLCNPSRTAIFTGLAPYRSGVYNNEQWYKPNLPNVVTLPEYLRKHGYHVAGAGKVLHHVAGFNPLDQWDEFQLQQFDDVWYRRAEWYPWVKKTPAPPGHPFSGIKNIQGEFDWGVLPKAEEEYDDQQAVNFGISFLQRKHTKPFFLCVGLFHPHIPMFAPKKYFDLYPLDKLQLPETDLGDLDDVPEVAKRFAAVRREEWQKIQDEGKNRQFIQAYLASITFMDAMLGRFLDAFAASAYAKNTTLIFWSDNGWHLGEKQHVHKSTLWQRSTQIPLLVKGPGVRQPGVARRQPVTLQDLHPTVLALAGVPARNDIDGKSLVPYLQKPNAKGQPALITFERGNYAVVDERYRYIRYHDGSEELYDFVADRRERKNLLANAGGESSNQQSEWFKVRDRLRAQLPKDAAPGVPERSAFVFDYSTTTWKRKSEPRQNPQP